MGAVQMISCAETHASRLATLPVAATVQGREAFTDLCSGARPAPGEDALRCALRSCEPMLMTWEREGENKEKSTLVRVSAQALRSTMARTGN